jgi:hypothetical protein
MIERSRWLTIGLLISGFTLANIHLSVLILNLKPFRLTGLYLASLSYTSLSLVFAVETLISENRMTCIRQQKDRL